MPRSRQPCDPQTRNGDCAREYHEGIALQPPEFASLYPNDLPIRSPSPGSFRPLLLRRLELAWPWLTVMWLPAVTVIPSRQELELCLSWRKKLEGSTCGRPIIHGETSADCALSQLSDVYATMPRPLSEDPRAPPTLHALMIRRAKDSDGCKGACERDNPAIPMMISLMEIGTPRDDVMGLFSQSVSRLLHAAVAGTPPDTVACTLSYHLWVDPA
ncbi:hypothetical protein HU200_017205 [Digitaria exilis]|uniref:Uncharacterized protein n=1 Tax=Digitaria exilis TaxID=1010633 RepID=A0A835F7B0_9POAL|nr:hypothetical protein HU200_017205 [Digitaria exilis]CAB3451237.1 unnamed protein product [Digitaria exilis]